MYEKLPEKVDLRGAVENYFYHYVEFRGRSSRSEWGYIWLFHAIVFVPLLLITSVSEEIGGVFFGLFVLGTFIPSIALTVRRLRDGGFSPYSIFWSFVPFIGGIWVFVLCLFDSAYPPDFRFYEQEDEVEPKSMNNIATEIEELQDLHDRGLIDDEQLKAAKNKALGI